IRRPIPNDELSLALGSRQCLRGSLAPILVRIDDQRDVGAAKQHLFAIGRPDWEGSAGRTVERQLAQLRGFGVDYPDFVIAAAVRSEGDLFSIRRPTWITIEVFIVGKVSPIFPIAIHYDDIVLSSTR